MNRKPRRRPSRPRLSAFDALQQYWTLSACTGQEMPTDQLVALVRQHNWVDGLKAVATMSAIAANARDPKAKARWSTDALIAELDRGGLGNAAMASRLREDLNRPIVHEEGLLVLQTLFVLYGAEEGGRPASPAHVAFLLLALSDHLGTEDGDTTLTRTEKGLAIVARAMRFDRVEDLLRELARAEALFNERRVHAALLDEESWGNFLQEALGASLEEFVDRRLTPLALLSSMWGVEEDPVWYFPLIDVHQWTAEVEGRDFPVLAEDLAWSRDELQVHLKASARHLIPQHTGHFYRKPFVKLSDGRHILAVSPRAVRWILRAAAWARCLNFAKAALPGGATTWLSIFGYLVEGWCRTLAEMAKREGLRDELILPTSPGSNDEIADVVFKSDQGVVLCSVKSRMMREDVIRSAGPRRTIVDWYENFFFEEKKVGHRQESLWQMQRAIARIRGGEFVDKGIARDSRIYPVVIVYDEIGDHPGLYRWLRERCEFHEVLRGSRIEPLTVCTLSDFEVLLATAVRKHGLVSLVHRKTRPPLRDVPLRPALGEVWSGNLPRLAELEARYDQLMERARQRLFPAPGEELDRYPPLEPYPQG